MVKPKTSIRVITDIDSKEGIILWIPKNPDWDYIMHGLKDEVACLNKSKTIPNKEDIIALLEQAILHSHAYPYRKLRFYKEGFEWENPDEGFDMPFSFRYNPSRDGKETIKLPTSYGFVEFDKKVKPCIK